MNIIELILLVELVAMSFLVGMLVEREAGPYKKLYNEVLEEWRKTIEIAKKLNSHIPTKSPIQINHDA